jgi:hypothetical protein
MSKAAAIRQSDLQRFKDRLAQYTDEEDRPSRWNYFILNPETGLIKIGFSFQPSYRINQLQKNHVATLELLHQQHGDRFDEKDLHRRFADHHECYEWFRCEGALAEYLKSVCGYEP